MPIYTFKCKECGRDEEMLLAVADISSYHCNCPECGCSMVKQIDLPGEPQTDHPSWINDDMRKVLQKDGEKPIETRTEHKQYLKERGIIHRA